MSFLHLLFVGSDKTELSLLELAMVTCYVTGINTTFNSFSLGIYEMKLLLLLHRPIALLQI